MNEIDPDKNDHEIVDHEIVNGDDVDSSDGSSYISDSGIFKVGLSGYLNQVFGTRSFRKLWIAEAISATGDWLGLFATVTLAAGLSEGSEGAAIALVLATRILPGLFLATAVSVFIDRLNRKHVMIACDLGRAAVLLVLPFVNSLIGLVIASFVLELLTMMWQPAKEACIPQLVPREKLTTANSLNFIAAYGTFPLAAGLASVLSRVAKTIVVDTDIADNSRISGMLFSEEGLAFFFDALTFMMAAFIVSRIHISGSNLEKRQLDSKGSLDFWGAFRELREGWRLVFVDPIVRTVNIGLAVGLMGGGLLVPLGAVFVDKVIVEMSLGSFSENLRIDPNFNENFSLVLFALGVGVAIGVIVTSIVGQRIAKSRLSTSGIFAFSLIGAGCSLFVAVSSDKMSQVLPFVALLGLLAGPVYVLGFTMLHEKVDDLMRGRIFAALFVLIRLSLLAAFAVAPLLSDLLDRLSASRWDSYVTVFGSQLHIPGVRLTLWLAALIIVAAGVLSMWSLRPTRRGFNSNKPPINGDHWGDH
ncbi:MAG: MFS transporter [Acidimicrobiaceae bacterium]|nr:MFS transporter [Acidimicrobiaceae bacterium]